ncbi:MAG TPA: integrase arm-type DNA-binding domain-containing protein [Devosiaceae bacterium]|jgi:integrase|nr:integrase arm-type DNA-binding domain-containing protein [Devosiaceae bacterium]
MPLTDIACRNTKPREKQYKLSDGGGLQLVVTPAGGKHWRLAYRFAGKEKTLSFGAYPTVKLADAREQRDDARKLLRQGINPAELRKERIKAAATEVENTFEAIAREWHENEKGGWVQAHADRVLSRLEHDVFPKMGAKAIDAIEAPDVLAVIRSVEARGALDVAKRIRQSVGAVFRYGIATGRARRDPSGDLRGALKPAPRVRHHAYLRETQLPEFLGKLDAYDGEARTRLAINLTLLTMLRTNEVRFGRWEELEGLDGGRPLWRIPAERMKARREHLVPLAPQAVSILMQIKSEAGKSSLMFPTPGKDGVMSQNTMIFALYRMGYHSKLTIHGFRRTASTILNEYGFNRDWIERQLAHGEQDEIRAAYNAAEWLQGRREMLAWWADYVEKMRGRTRGQR